MWTQFWDMHSGGGAKEKWPMIYIEAPKNVAEIVFYNRFGHSPNRVTCTCCGEDYSVSEYESLEQATGYHRGCKYEDGNYIEVPERKGRLFQPLFDYIKNPDILVIRKEDIKYSETEGELPTQGYVWVG
jgi:hypothetical protein